MRGLVWYIASIFIFWVLSHSFFLFLIVAFLPDHSLAYIFRNLQDHFFHLCDIQVEIILLDANDSGNGTSSDFSFVVISLQDVLVIA